jgi:hypothetical protein
MAGNPENTNQKHTPSIAPKQRIGFLAGQLTIPDDFDTTASAEIEALFTGSPDKPQFEDEP